MLPLVNDTGIVVPAARTVPGPISRASAQYGNVTVEPVGSAGTNVAPDAATAGAVAVAATAVVTAGELKYNEPVALRLATGGLAEGFPAYFAQFVTFVRVTCVESKRYDPVVPVVVHAL